GDLRLGSPEDRQRRGALSPDIPAQEIRDFQARYRLQANPQRFILSALDRAAEAARRPLPTGLVDMRSRDDRLDYSYRADDPVDVPSDGQLHTVPLAARPITSRLRYVVVPREDTAVYRLAQLDNPLKAPLLTGPTEVYVDGRYVLSTVMPTVLAAGSFEMGLGVEQAIQCARNTRFEEIRSGERVVAMTELRHEIEITLANHLPRPVDCEIRERVPTPALDAEVVVEEGEVRPAWSSYDQVERGLPLAGGRRWRVKIPARGAEALKAQYTVKIYANNELVGGDRRER
ncbi:DUF4139 domain-containing protein, partial [Myxococcota bacterium]|nr:DUF4139 domain-containing protein [Myxococcota bacterium]